MSGEKKEFGVVFTVGGYRGPRNGKGNAEKLGKKELAWRVTADRDERKEKKMGDRKRMGKSEMEVPPLNP